MSVSIYHSPFLIQQSCHFFQSIRKIDFLLPFFGGQLHLDHVVEQCLHMVVIAVEIIENARCIQMVQRQLAHHLGNLLERARTARKGDERVSKLDHFGFAIGHILGDDQLGQTVQLQLLLDKKARLYADYLAACGQCARRDRTHQTDP